MGSQWIHVKPCAEIPAQELPTPRAIELVRRHDNELYCSMEDRMSCWNQSVHFFPGKWTVESMTAHPLQALHVAMKAIADKEAVWAYCDMNIPGNTKSEVSWILRDGLQRIYQRMPRSGYYLNLLPTIGAPPNDLTPRTRKDIFFAPFGAILFLFKTSPLTMADMTAFDMVAPEIRAAVLSFLTFELQYSEVTHA